jgi:hypothetical protein
LANIFVYDRETYFLSIFKDFYYDNEVQLVLLKSTKRKVSNGENFLLAATKYREKNLLELGSGKKRQQFTKRLPAG